MSNWHIYVYDKARHLTTNSAAVKRLFRAKSRRNIYRHIIWKCKNDVIGTLLAKQSHIFLGIWVVTVRKLSDFLASADFRCHHMVVVEYLHLFLRPDIRALTV
jgi:hypothetical protein